jgi:hypothetical protein
MTNQTKNPIFWCLVVVVIGAILGAWGLTKVDCNSSPDCYKGSGFLLWTGGLLLLAGLIGWGIFGMGNKKQ